MHYRTRAARIWPRRRTKRQLIAGALLILLAMLISELHTAAQLADMLTRPNQGFQPEPTPASYHVDYQNVRLMARGGDVQLAGWYMPSAQSRRAVLLVHGKSVNRLREFGGGFLTLAAALNRRGMSVLMIDLRAHGQSGGQRAGFGAAEARDIMGAVDWLRALGFAPGQIGVLGVSTGAAAAILASAADSDIGALVADCAFADMPSLLQRHWGGASGGQPAYERPLTMLMGRLLGYDAFDESPLQQIAEIAPRPVLIVHGADDGLVPVSDARALAAAGPSAQLWVVDGAGHGGSYLKDPQRYTQRVGDFFSQNLR